MIHDIIADDEIKAALIQREPRRRVCLKAISPRLQIYDEPVNIVVSGADRKTSQWVDADGSRGRRQGRPPNTKGSDPQLQHVRAYAEAVQCAEANEGGGLRNFGKHVSYIVYGALPNRQLVLLRFLPG